MRWAVVTAGRRHDGFGNPWEAENTFNNGRGNAMKKKLTAMRLGEAALGEVMAGWHQEPRLALCLALASQPSELAAEMILAAVSAEIQLRCDGARSLEERIALVDLGVAVDGLARELDLYHIARAQTLAERA